MNPINNNVYVINENLSSNNNVNSFNNFNNKRNINELSDFRSNSFVKPTGLTVIYDDINNDSSSDSTKSNKKKKLSFDINKNSTIFLKFPKFGKSKQQNYSFESQNNKSDVKNTSDAQLTRTNSIFKNSYSKLILSWENVNVYNKSKRPIFDIFKTERSESILSLTNSNNNNYKSSDFFNKYESNLAPNDDSSVSTISYNRKSNESKSIESISSTSSSTRLSKTKHILINSNYLIYHHLKKINYLILKILIVNGLVQSGECMAIMGASGSGKTTL